ncbi:MAG: hypothetical protein A3K68_03150 [Euryarchaeota archaeon RBG_16_68_13]|nr:MAG: hypothetical protein A3K68_03150 [Euryarchaeota archaeon RBG_16_68_13]
MRIGGSTYSKEPFPNQLDALREMGFDYAEIDLAYVRWQPSKLAEEAALLAKRIPLETAHFPAPRFANADLARFVGFIEALVPLGTTRFNLHFLEARAGPRVSPEAKISWLSDLVRAATDRGAVVTVENLDEPPSLLRRALDEVRGLRTCLDLGHAHLDGRTDGGREYLAALGDRLDLVHVHDNHGGHGKEGDEHLAPGKGTIDVERDVRAIRAASYDGRMTLEVFVGTPEDKKAALRKMRHWVQ